MGDLAVFLALCAMTCGGPQAFECAGDDQCAGNQGDGICQDNGFCSFPDGACASGQRYGANAAADIAGQCVPLPSGTTSVSGTGTSTSSGGTTSGTTTTAGTTVGVTATMGGSTGGVLGPFGQPMIVRAIEHPMGADDPTLPDSRLELFFNTTRTGGLGGSDIWVSVRTTTADSFGPPLPADALNTLGTETTPRISADGLTMLIGSDRDGNTDIYLSTRAAPGSPWSTPTAIAEVNSGVNDIAAMVSSDGLQMFLCRISTDEDLFHTTRTDPDGVFAAPMPIDALNTTDNDCDPWIGPDADVLYFSSSRPGRGSFDLYLTTRSRDDGWATPTPIDSLNTADEQTDPWLVDDQRVIYFSQRSPGGVNQIYRAER